MTLVAINAVVDVAADVLMIRIGGSFSVAVRTLEDCVVAGIGVARRTDSIRPTVPGIEPGVVEGRACPPGYHLVAGLAGGWESCGYMVRIIRGLVLGFVTRIAIAGNRGVVVVHMAACARDAGVRAHQRESRVVVVERGRLPRGRAMADIALLRKSPSHVIGIRCARIVFQMATNTCCSRQIVIVVFVAIGAL